MSSEKDDYRVREDPIDALVERYWCHMKGQKAMPNCPSELDLIQYMEGESPEVKIHDMQQHLLWCARCRAVILAMQQPAVGPFEDLPTWEQLQQGFPEELRTESAAEQPEGVPPTESVTAEMAPWPASEPALETERKALVARMAEFERRRESARRHFFLWATPATAALLLVIVFLMKSRHDQQRIMVSQAQQIAELRRENQMQKEQMARMPLAKPNDRPEVRPAEPRGYYKGPFYSLVLTMVPVRSPGERMIPPARGEALAIPQRANTLDLAIKLDDRQRHDHYAVEIKDLSGGLIWKEEDLMVDEYDHVRFLIPKNQLEAKEYLINIYGVDKNRHDLIGKLKISLDL